MARALLANVAGGGCVWLITRSGCESFHAPSSPPLGPVTSPLPLLAPSRPSPLCALPGLSFHHTLPWLCPHPSVLSSVVSYKSHGPHRPPSPPTAPVALAGGSRSGGGVTRAGLEPAARPPRLCPPTVLSPIRPGRPRCPIWTAACLDRRQQKTSLREHSRQGSPCSLGLRHQRSQAFCDSWAPFLLCRVLSVQFSAG